MDLVVDKCPDSSLDVIISLNGSLASWLDCQNLCDTVYQEDCKSVMYMDKEQSCTISKTPYEDYIENCGVFGGAHETPSGCLRDNTKYPDQCKFMLQGDCEFQGNLILESPDVVDPEQCLSLSEALGGNYYYLDEASETCRVYDNGSRSCNVQHSVPGAIAEGCEGEN